MIKAASVMKSNYFAEGSPLQGRAARAALVIVLLLLLVLPNPSTRPASAQDLDPPTVDLEAASDTGTSDTDNITNDATPTFSGTAREADSIVQIFDDSTLIGRTTADQSGNWSVTPTSSLDDGEHSITAVANGSTSDTLVVTIDTAAPSAPVITDPANDSHDNDGTFTVSGTAEADSTVELFEGTDSKGTATADGSGSWSIELTGVTEDTHTYTATATDAAGNTSSSSDPVAVTVDTTEPGAPEITSPADNTTTNDDTPTFSGMAESNSTVEVFDGSTSLGTTTADESGNWSLTPDSALSDDTHSITATATDKAGHTSSASTPLSITIDTVAPTAPVIADPDNNSRDNNGAFTISGTAEPNSTVNLFDGADLKETIEADSSGYWSKVLTGVADGRHTYTATAVDDAGNESEASNAVRVTVDTVAPETTIASGPPDETNSTTATFAFSSSEPNSWFECKLDGGEFDYCTSPTTYNDLSQSSHTFEVRAMDVAGNTDSTPASSTFTVDHTAPAQPTVDLDGASDTGSSDTDNITSENTPTFSGTAEADSTVTIYNGETPLGEIVADSSGSYSFTPSTPLSDGTYSITVEAKDAAGNTSVASTTLSITIDTKAPRTTIDNDPSGTTNDNTPTFGFVSDEDGSTFECRLTEGDNMPGDFESCNSPETFPEQSDEAYTFEVRATDVAGNTEAPPASRTFTVDTHVPDAPVITEPANDSYDTDGNFRVSGTAETNSTVELFEGEQSKGTATADGSGNWSIALTAVAEGPHTYTAKATDAADNTSSSGTVVVTVDSIGPETTIDSGPSRVGSDRSASFKFSSEADATFECSLDGDTFTDCFSPQQYTNLEDGEHTFEVRATDVAGNKEGTPVPHTWTVDTVTSRPVVTSPDKKGYDKDGTFTISGTAEPNATVELSEGTTSKGTATANTSGNWSVELTDVVKGEHNYTATATDTVSNTSEASDPVVMVVDKTRPKVTRVEPADQATGRSLDRNVTARFSEKMNPDSVIARNIKLINTRTGSEVKAKVRCDDLCRTLRLDPNRNLEKNTKYRMVISTRVEDLAGNRLPQQVWHFTTVG